MFDLKRLNGWQIAACVNIKENGDVCAYCKSKEDAIWRLHGHIAALDVEIAELKREREIDAEAIQVMGRDLADARKGGD